MKSLNLSTNTRMKVLILYAAISTSLVLFDKMKDESWVMFNIFAVGFFIGGKTADNFAMRGRRADPSNL